MAGYDHKQGTYTSYHGYNKRYPIAMTVRGLADVWVLQRRWMEGWKDGRMEGWKDVGIDGADRARIQEEMIDDPT